MRRNFRNRILVGAMLLFVFISITTNLITYEINRRNTQRAILDKNMLALTALCNDLSREIVSMENQASMILIHPNVYDYIKYCYSEVTLDIPFYDKMQYHQEIQRYFFGMQLYEPALASISIIIGGQKLDHFAVRSGISPESLGLIINSEWYSTVCKQDEAYFLGCHDSYFAKSTDNLKNIENRQYFSVAKSVRNMTTKEVYGVVLCCYDAEELIEEYSVSLAEEIHSFMIVEKDTGRILLGSQPYNKYEEIPVHLPELLLSDDVCRTYEGGMTIQSEVKGTDYVIIADIPMIASMYQTANSMLAFAITITVVGIGIFYVMALIYSHRIARPVNAILDTIRALESGNLSARVDESKTEDEFVDIAQRLNSMGERMGQLMKETKQKEREKNEATFLALQMQINPHFLCNTLNSIRLTALMNEQEEISDMLEATTRILSASFKNSSPYTTLGEDMRAVQSYVAIMKMRYGDVFEIHYEIDADAADCRILRFMIQPCVENAILHGMIPRSEPGRIDISAGVIEGELMITINDNGVGTDRDLTELAEREEKGSKYNSIGLSNVISRMKLTYGERARATLHSTVNCGTRICFYLPVEKRRESERI